MNELTCIVIGGGHAGLQALKAIRETTRGMANGRRIRFVLIDRQPGHLRKMLLFRPAVGEEEIMIPWTHWFSEGVDLVQGAVTSMACSEQRIRYMDMQGNDADLRYDLAVVAVGSVVRRPAPEQGGIALTDPQAAADIRERWRSNLRKAVLEANPAERKRLMTVAVAGAGTSGIETSSELALAMREEASALGLNASDVAVYLLNAQERLFPIAPEKVGRKLELTLNQCGVTVLHKRKALREEADAVTLDSGDRLPASLCIWTIGLMPNPALRSMGLPLTSEGQVLVDESYRVQGAPGVYSIGDCARIVDPRTGKADMMTCKEGGIQADRLGKIVLADLEGRPAPVHQSLMDFFCIGMGENRGMVWGRKWGVNMTVTGRTAWKFRNVAWKAGSKLL